jgi:hypothetical protein
MFNPRMDLWSAIFSFREGMLDSASATGRATMVALAMNRLVALAIRLELARLGRQP